jgi:SAM-dependent methyltransferase
MTGFAGRALQRVLRAMPKPPYERASYWDKIYADTFAQQGAVEWGLPPAQLLRYQWLQGDTGAVTDAGLEEHADKCADVIVVGCGNSGLSEAMVHSGWDASKLVSVDFSPTCIEQAEGRARLSGDKRLAALRFLVADCRALHTTFAAGSFDCAVDKGMHLLCVQVYSRHCLIRMCGTSDRKQDSWMRFTAARQRAKPSLRPHAVFCESSAQVSFAMASCSTIAC